MQNEEQKNMSKWFPTVNNFYGLKDLLLASIFKSPTCHGGCDTQCVIKDISSHRAIVHTAEVKALMIVD